jgi:nucleotidyltransferase-like protein
VDQALGSPAHQALIAHVVAHYADDDRIRAVAVFGSVGAGTWHELSDVDFDVVTEDGARVDPGAEIAALFGSRAVIVLTGADAADVVLGSREELSVRWHPLRTTSPNIGATVRVAAAACPPPTWSRPETVTARGLTRRGGSTSSSATPSTRRRRWSAGSDGRRSRRSSGSAGR